MHPVRWETMAYLFQAVGINDDNIGMACVIVHRIFIFLHFPQFCYTWEGGNSNLKKIYLAAFLYRCFILLRMTVFMYWIFISMHYFNIGLNK